MTTRHRRGVGDEGAATTETVILVPLVLFTILLVVQLGLYFHAINVASAAAQEGAHEASLRQAEGGATASEAALEEGEQTAQDFIDRFGSELLSDVSVEGAITDGDQMARVTVAGDVAATIVVPGLDAQLSVSETAQSPVERFRPSGDTPTVP